LVQYFNAFATVLGPNSVGTEGHNRQLEQTKVIKKSTGNVTRTVTTVGIVEAIDPKKCLITVKGKEQSVDVNVSMHFDFSMIGEGDEVGLVYIESYAINVVPASRILGEVSIKSTSVALGIGYGWGQGELTLYDGSIYTFDIEGISMLDVGMTLIKAEGTGYRVIEPEDIEGDYWAAEMGISYGNGASAVTMKNSNGVTLRISSQMKGMKLTLATGGVRIKNVMPIQ